MATAFRLPALSLCATLLLCSARSIAARPATAPASASPVKTSAQLFEPTKVWMVHLRFTPEQWAAMEPKGDPDWTKAFANAVRDTSVGATTTSLASTMLKRGDRDHNGKVNRDEFLALADRWFTRWDQARRGSLDVRQLQAGLDLILDPEGVTQDEAFPISLRGGEGRHNGLAGSLGIEFTQVHADLDFQDALFKDIGIRYKGNGTYVDSRTSLKRPLKITLNQFAREQSLAGVSTLNLHNNVADPSYMNDALSYRLYREAGVPSPRTTYARVYVTVPAKQNHKYLGLYSLAENVDAYFATEHFGTDKGAMLKPATPSLFADLGEDWSDYQQTYDPKAAPTPEQARRVIDFAALVTYADDEQFAARLGDYLDLDEFARYMAVTTYLSTLDSILLTGQNFYLYLHPATNKFQFIPWDLDHSFGQIFGEQEQLANLSIHHPWAGPNRFLERVFKVEAFKKAYLARLDEFSRTLFKPERFHQQVNEIAAAIRPAIKEESSSKLSQFDKTGAGGSIKAGKGWFAPSPVKSIKGFVDARTPSVLDQLAGKSQGEQAKSLGAFGGRGGRPGQSLSPLIMAAMDANKDGKLTRAEFAQGFERWFSAWDTNRSGSLTDDQLRAGIDSLNPTAKKR